MKAVFASWIRLFGPPRFFVTDQEGAIKSDLVGKCCERFNIDRDFGGSQGHTAAPMAERRIEIIRLGAQKLWGSVVKQGLRTTKEEVVIETAMATNMMMTYGGATPTQALLGYQPRELYDPEANTITSLTSALDVQPDAMETALRLRLEAKDYILQAVVEDRIARASNTRVQQHRPEEMAKLVDGARIDLWREPDTKDDPGWRGPAELVKRYPDGGRCIVEWRGHVMLVPIRHVRPHVGFVWWTSPTERATTESADDAAAVQELMSAIEQGVPFQVLVFGLMWSAAAREYANVPEDLESRPPRIFVLARRVSTIIGQVEFAGIQFGTQVKRTRDVTGAGRARLLQWNSNGRESYRILDVDPSRSNLLQSTFSSFCMFYSYVPATAEEERIKPRLDLSDVGLSILGSSGDLVAPSPLWATPDPSIVEQTFHSDLESPS